MTVVRRDGFSLIEALVALTIAALMLTAIFELQQQMARGQRRALNAIYRVAAQENAIALVRNVNPMATPTGMIQLPAGDKISWTATAIGPARNNAGFPKGDGLFIVQLFLVTVSIEDGAGRRMPVLSFERLGWKRLESP